MKYVQRKLSVEVMQENTTNYQTNKMILLPTWTSRSWNRRQSCWHVPWSRCYHERFPAIRRIPGQLAYTLKTAKHLGDAQTTLKNICHAIGNKNYGCFVLYNRCFSCSLGWRSREVMIFPPCNLIDKYSGSSVWIKTIYEPHTVSHLILVKHCLTMKVPVIISDNN